MDAEESARTQLATFDPGLADAVVTVLRRAGVRAWSRRETGSEETAVHVPEDERSSALDLLADSMDEVHALARPGAEASRPAPRPAGEPVHEAAEAALDEEDGPPIVMERLRRMGFLALMLAPLLVITLALPHVSLTVALVVYVGGLVVLTWWRNRGRDAHE